MKKGVFAVLFWAVAVHCWAGDLVTIGVTLLRQTNPSLNGSGVPVAQVEVLESANAWETSPSYVGQPTSLFTWTSSSGTATTFPNGVGTESSHADAVGNLFYGFIAGVSPGVSHVYDYEANYFFNSIVSAAPPAAMPARVVNQSFIAGTNQTAIDQSYDNYAAAHNVLFVSGIGNAGAVNSPGTSFNGLGVAAYDGPSSIGPNGDGRSKPDITAPGGFTSFTTPLVAGGAALLIQAGNQSMGGTNVSAATDIRTVKALLLNGTVKPANWTNSAANPIDQRYGAGILNVFNSFKQLTSGQRPYSEATSHTVGSAHGPGNSPTFVSSLSGWDFNAITNAQVGANYQDRVHHYYFTLTNVPSGAYTLTATLVWNRPAGSNTINDLDLFLYNKTNGTLVASSTSSVDNIGHIFIPSLASGQYDLQVLKNGASAKRITTSESYALAFETFAMPLSIVRSTTNVVVSWPIYPTGFVLQSTASLNTPTTWSTVNVVPTVTNNMNVVTFPASSTAQFFRLRRP